MEPKRNFGDLTPSLPYVPFLAKPSSVYGRLFQMKVSFNMFPYFYFIATALNEEHFFILEKSF
jgi:hypothetical protein